MKHSHRAIARLLVVAACCFSSGAAASGQTLDLSKDDSVRITVNEGTPPNLSIVNRVPGLSYNITVVAEPREIPPIKLPASVSFVAPRGDECLEMDHYVSEWREALGAAADERAVALTLASTTELRAKLTEKCWPSYVKEVASLIARTRSEVDLSDYVLLENQQLVVTVSRIDPAGGFKTWSFAMQTAAAGEWLTTWGFTFINDRNDYFVQQAETDSTFRIVQARRPSLDDLKFVPSVFFHWMPRGRLTKNWAFSWLTGGVGVKSDAPAVFAGMSVTRRQNLSLAWGLAVARARRLHPELTEKQILKERLPDDALYANTYRPGAFISLAIRFDRNPFGGGGTTDEEKTPAEKKEPAEKNGGGGVSARNPAARQR